MINYSTVSRKAKNHWEIIKEGGGILQLGRCGEMAGRNISFYGKKPRSMTGEMAYRWVLATRPI